MNYIQAMKILLPNAQWAAGETYESIRMLDSTPKPSEQALIEVLSDQTPVLQWTVAEFFKRFTDEERLAIVTSVNPQITVMRYILSLYPLIYNNNTDLLAGLSYAVSVGLLTEERKLEILGL